jgi:hypothetical protein
VQTDAKECGEEGSGLCGDDLTIKKWVRRRWIYWLIKDATYLWAFSIEGGRKDD